MTTAAIGTIAKLFILFSITKITIYTIYNKTKCGDCILCGGAEENEYTPDEKRNLQASFRALELIEANKNETKPLKDKPTNDNKPNEYEKNNNNKSVNHIQNQSQDKKEEIIAKEKLDASINSTLKTELKNKTNAGNDEADRVRKLVEETTKRTNEVNK